MNGGSGGIQLAVMQALDRQLARKALHGVDSAIRIYSRRPERVEMRWPTTEWRIALKRGYHFAAFDNNTRASRAS